MVEYSEYAIFCLGAWRILTLSNLVGKHLNALKWKADANTGGVNKAFGSGPDI